MICAECSTKLKYVISVQKNEMHIKIFECPKCGEKYDVRNYLYTPKTCPKHHWYFDRWGHKDGLNSHETFWIMKCDRCGKTDNSIRFDSRAVGLRQSVDLEDPRVLDLLDLNKDTARFHLPADDVANFWKN